MICVCATSFCFPSLFCLQNIEKSKRIDKENQKEIQKQNEVIADEYIVRAVQEKNLLYLSFFLHGYEHKLNGKVYSFLKRNGMDTYDPALFLDMKLALQELILKKLPTYDSSRDAKFLTYLHHFIYDTFKLFRMQQECWTIDSLDKKQDIHRRKQKNTWQRLSASGRGRRRSSLTGTRMIPQS